MRICSHVYGECGEQIMQCAMLLTFIPCSGMRASWMLGTVTNNAPFFRKFWLIDCHALQKRKTVSSFFMQHKSAYAIGKESCSAALSRFTLCLFTTSALQCQTCMLQILFSLLYKWCLIYLMHIHYLLRHHKQAVTEI